MKWREPTRCPRASGCAALAICAWLIAGCSGALPHSRTASTTRQTPAARAPSSTAKHLAKHGGPAPRVAARSTPSGGADAGTPSAIQAASAPPAIPSPATPISIEDPSGHALSAFHAALSAVQTEGGRARLVFYGASHVAADFYTDVVRSKLQARFGEAGAGFVLPAKPVAGYRNAAINIGRATGFHGVNVLAKAPLSDRYGLAGAYLRTRRKGASGWFETRAHAGLPGHASRFELYYLKQRGGGHLRVTIDGVAHEIPTEAHDYTTAYQTFEVADGAHRFELEAIGDGPTHTFGVSVERDVPGVVLDTLGIPGARVRYHLLWQDAIYREHLARLKPSLVVLAYGTNEAGDDDVPIEKYANDLQAVLARIRSVVPNASCLLIGPSDHPISNGNGTYSDRPRTAEIIAAQRQAAERFGCGFFDLVAFMGGPLSMLRWTAAVPPFGTPDHIHFMRRGYEELGRVLYDGLMAGYSEHPLSPEPSPPTPPPQPTAADASVTAASPDTPQSP